MDILTFGSPKIIRNLTSYKINTTEISLQKILDKIKLTHEEFIEFCILLGSDYCYGITEIKPNIIYNYYFKNKSIEKTLENMKADNLNVPTEINYQETKKYFLEPNIKKVSQNDLKLKEPNCDKLLEKLVNKYGLIKYLIKIKLDKLNKQYDTLKNY
jgi:flap endonuclease-1